jgi:hypothetical protein
MSIEFKWSISKVRVDQQGGKSNIVVNAEWRAEGTDEEFTASAAGHRDFILGDSFIEFSQLTEQQVLDWCFAPEEITLVDRDNVSTTFTKVLKDEVEAQLSGQIARQLAQKAAEPALPWVTA